MASVNRVTLVGRLGTDPDLKYTNSGVPVAKFSLATSETFMDKAGQKQEETTWHKIVTWQKLAENCGKYLAKGRQVYVEGKITTVTWDDKQTGKKCYATEIVANNIQFLGDQQARQQGPQPGQEQPGHHHDSNPALDDIPF